MDFLLRNRATKIFPRASSLFHREWRVRDVVAREEGFWYNWAMKMGIHPQYQQITVSCACGNTFVTGSTKSDIRVEICSMCHPFFTGEMRFVDTMGRVERFQQKQQAMVGKAVVVKKKDKKLLKKKAIEASEAAKPKSLKEMMEMVKRDAKKTDTN